MKKNNRIANTYAKSLLLEAEQQKCFKSVNKDVAELLLWWSEVEAFQHLFTSGIITPEKKLAVWDKLAKKSFDALSVGFVRLLIRHHRESLLGDILLAFQRLYKASQGIVTVHVESAHDLGKTQIVAIEKKIMQKIKSPLEVTTSVDPSLIGGFVLTTNNKRIDLSIKGRLQHIKETITSH